MYRDDKSTYKLTETTRKEMKLKLELIQLTRTNRTDKIRHINLLGLTLRLNI